MAESADLYSVLRTFYDHIELYIIRTAGNEAAIELMNQKFEENVDDAFEWEWLKNPATGESSMTESAVRNLIQTLASTETEDSIEVHWIRSTLIDLGKIREAEYASMVTLTLPSEGESEWPEMTNLQDN